MFTDRDQIEASLRSAGVSAARAAEFAVKAKPSVWLETALPADNERFPLGTTKIGGRPDLPAGTEWPFRPSYPDASDRIAEIAAASQRIRAGNEEALADGSPYASPRDQIEARAKEMTDEAAPVAEGRPLAFIAQFDLAEIHVVQPLDADIPVTGRLLFFFDAQQQPWGFRPGDAAGWKVLYDTTTPAALVRATPPPSPGPPGMVAGFRALRCRGRTALSPVPEDEVTLPRLARSDPDHAALASWYEDLNSDLLDRTDWRAHQAGGHPDQIQGGMQLECQLVSNGIDRGGDRPGDRTEIARLAEGAEDWLLLMQIDSDDRNGMLWGDSGMLYVWIRRDDLRARRFDRSWVILQCL